MIARLRHRLRVAEVRWHQRRSERHLTAAAAQEVDQPALPWISNDHRCTHRAAAADRKLMADEFYALFRSEAEAARTMRNAVLDIHKPVPTWTDSTYDERGVQIEQNALYGDDGVLVAAPDYRRHCATCPVDTSWPCPTALAVGVSR